jgi:hypothetical protein
VALASEPQVIPQNGAVDAVDSSDAVDGDMVAVADAARDTAAPDTASAVMAAAAERRRRRVVCMSSPFGRRRARCPALHREDA